MQNDTARGWRENVQTEGEMRSTAHACVVSAPKWRIRSTTSVRLREGFTLFFEDVLQHRFIERQVRDHTLQFRILVLALR